MTRDIKINKKRVSNRLDMGLYVVATPIGNTDDWSRRALETLSNAHIIAAEDTRIIKQKLKEEGLSTTSIFYSYHDHNEAKMLQKISSLLLEGQSVALVSDAGTPQISDPGFRLIRECFSQNIPVKPIPGPSSLSCALSVCPIGGVDFYFAAFPPTQSGQRKTFFESLKNLPASKIIFFEAPHRVRLFFEETSSVFGHDRMGFVARELTKNHEELLYMNLEKFKNFFATNEPRGEFVIILEGCPPALLSKEELTLAAMELLDNGFSTSDVLEKLQPQASLNRKDLYNLILKLKKQKNV